MTPDTFTVQCRRNVADRHVEQNIVCDHLSVARCGSIATVGGIVMQTARLRSWANVSGQATRRSSAGTTAFHGFEP